ncbi:MAG: aminotransferase class V-fold PLP-dependent enzyme [Kofleriaceae bacterium]
MRAPTIREQFPALAAQVHGKRLAYLDSAATTLMPRVVSDAIAAAPAGNPGRGVHALAEAATVALEDARAAIARAIGGRSEEVVLTSGTTAAVNLVAQTWGRANLGPGDVVIASELEHHSNFVPWQQICAERGARFAVAPVDAAGRIELVLDGNVKLVAVAHVSNVLGSVAPIAELAARVHAAGALLFVDGAQAIAHLPVDVAALGCDFYAFSGHKVYGPAGIGVLWGRRALLEAMPPWQTGGGMVGTVDAAGTSFRAPPHRFEAGTPNIAGAIGLAAALRFRQGLTLAEDAIHAALVAAVSAAGGTVVGAPARAVVAFTLGDIHPHDIASIADGEGVALRSGHHCAQPLHRRLGLAATARASVACYSDLDDVEQFARALARVREVLG